MDRETFKKAFQERAKCFMASIDSVCGNKSIEWQIYECDPELEGDGSVSMVATPVMPVSLNSDKPELLEYCLFLMNQGFRLEVVVDWSVTKLKIGITSWEVEDEPEWCESINSDFLFRWNGVTGPENLGLSE